MLHHATQETRPADVDACVAFWALLGFTQVDVPGGLAGRSAWVERRGTQIHLLFVPEPVVPPKGHTAVLVDDFEAALAALRDAGHPVEAQPELWGAPRAFAIDPSGHRVELMAWPPS